MFSEETRDTDSFTDEDKTSPRPLAKFGIGKFKKSKFGEDTIEKQLTWIMDTKNISGFIEENKS